MIKKSKYKFCRHCGNTTEHGKSCYTKGDVENCAFFKASGKYGGGTFTNLASFFAMNSNERFTEEYLHELKKTNKYEDDYLLNENNKADKMNAFINFCITWGAKIIDLLKFTSKNN